MKIMIIFERFIVLMWKHLNFQLFLFLLLISECVASFYWGSARVNFDSSLFWNCIFTTKKNCGARISNFNINEFSWTTGNQMGFSTTFILWFAFMKNIKFGPTLSFCMYKKIFARKYWVSVDFVSPLLHNGQFECSFHILRGPLP